MVETKESSLRLNLERKIDESYDIIFGYEIFPKIAGWLAEKKLGSKYAIITDFNVLKLHALKLNEELKKKSLDSNIFTLPAGEENKTLRNCENVINNMSQLKYGRDSAVLALGGGMVGDI